ncbi:hypothetical protein SNEBB_008426 [Seison nebaliae]|nr:hypothetical protein SNEBB_008426 [Seison nebaliae]
MLMIKILIFVMCLFVYGSCKVCEFKGRIIDSDPTEIDCEFCMCKSGAVVCESQCEPVTCDLDETKFTSANGCCEICMAIPSSQK